MERGNWDNKIKIVQSERREREAKKREREKEKAFAINCSQDQATIIELFFIVSLIALKYCQQH